MAAQLKLPVLVIVSDNREYAILESHSTEHEKTTGLPGLDLPGLDLVALRQGLRLRRPTSWSSRDDLMEALKMRMAAEGPKKLEVAISPEVPPLLG